MVRVLGTEEEWRIVAITRVREEPIMCSSAVDVSRSPQAPIGAGRRSRQVLLVERG